MSQVRGQAGHALKGEAPYANGVSDLHQQQQSRQYANQPITNQQRLYAGQQQQQPNQQHRVRGAPPLPPNREPTL
ncbi:hypothetical protein CLOM_g10434 [Closterium sp. NIES-68]|nr:hypothetical protein CLOM_g10434 [Closterium sp. NIES-68]